jgi:DNA polymerase elongation subunit (family B)
MIMGREVIAESGIWTAKKRYMLNVWDSEGVRYEKPKLKIMGIETTRSSTPAIVREKLKKLKWVLAVDGSLRSAT